MESMVETSAMKTTAVEAGGTPIRVVARRTTVVVAAKGAGMRASFGVRF